MYTSGPLIVVYLLLYVWTAACSMLGLLCGLPGAPMADVAVAAWGGLAALFLVIFLLRVPLLDFFVEIGPRERLVLFLFHVAFFMSPRFFVARPPWILSFVALNLPLTALCLKQNEWHRLLLNNNLIVFGALAAYTLPEHITWAILGCLCAMWVVTLVFDHFAAVLEQARQGATGMGRILCKVAAQQTLHALAVGAPMVIATIWWGPRGWSLWGKWGGERGESFRPRPRPVEWGFWEFAQLALYTAALLWCCYLLAKLLRRYKSRRAPEPLGADIDSAAQGREVAPTPDIARRRPELKDKKRDRIVIVFEDFCETMRRLGRQRAAYQTAREYNASLSDLSPDRNLVERATRIFENARYGVEEIAERDVADFAEDTETLRLSAARDYAEKQSRPT